MTRVTVPTLLALLIVVSSGSCELCELCDDGSRPAQMTDAAGESHPHLLGDAVPRG
jgi:hypothetical protein